MDTKLEIAFWASITNSSIWAASGQKDWLAIAWLVFSISIRVLITIKQARIDAKK